VSVAEIAFVPGQIVEIEESDVERATAADGRTRVPFPSDPEDIRQMYERYAIYREELRAKKAEKERDKSGDEKNANVTVLEPGHQIDDPAKAPGAGGTLAKRLATAGFSVRAYRALARIDAVLYVSDSDEGDDDPHLAGDVRYEAHDLETVTVFGLKRAGPHHAAVHATWERKLRADKSPTSKFTGSTTVDPILGREWHSTQKQPRPLRDWEIKAGVPVGTQGLDQWLDAYAPKPPKPEPKKKKTSTTDEQPTEQEGTTP